MVIGFTIIRVWAVFVSLAIILSVHTGLSIDFSSMGLTGNYTTFLLVSALIFFSLSRSSMFEGVEETVEPNSKVTVEISQELIKNLEDFMATRKPHLANILTLEQLAKQAELPRRTLSNIINRGFGQNFFEFVFLLSVFVYVRA